jgi:hypothetical protein
MSGATRVHQVELRGAAVRGTLGQKLREAFQHRHEAADRHVVHRDLHTRPP